MTGNVALESGRGDVSGFRSVVGLSLQFTMAVSGEVFFLRSGNSQRIEFVFGREGSDHFGIFFNYDVRHRCVAQALRVIWDSNFDLLLFPSVRVPVESVEYALS
jgi:hypothetical protein